MNKTKVGYQQCYWRWMCNMARFDWGQIFPKHLIFLKRVINVFTRLQRKVLYKTFFQIAVGFHGSPEKFWSRHSIQLALGGRSSGATSRSFIDAEAILEEEGDEAFETLAMPQNVRELQVVTINRHLYNLFNVVSDFYIKHLLTAFNLI
jgi:hypothetical protein